MRRAEPGWFAAAFAIVAGVTAARLLLLAFNRTDLFEDESQYWFWGQSFAFGYYSKPPLIGWVIGAVTALAGDAPFWVRAPGAVLHGATALILAASAARLTGARSAVWVAAGYVTLPMVAVGSLLMSTDTIMLPLLAAAFHVHLRLIAEGGLRRAVLVGALAGLAVMAKYIGLFFPAGVALAALLAPGWRISGRAAAAMALAFAVVVLPNLLWNAANGFPTLSHTMDNVGWVRHSSALGDLEPLRGLAFLAEQAAVMGPVLFVALAAALVRPGGLRVLPVFVVPVLAVVTAQAVLDKAYANWAVSAYLVGTILAMAVLARHPRWRLAGVAINAAFCLALPLLTIFPQTTLGRDAPLLSRYLGRADLSRQIIAAARAAGDVPVVAQDRAVLADLFYTGAGSGLAIYAPPPSGRPMNHYEQTRPLPAGLPGTVLWVASAAPVCDGETVAPDVVPRTAGGAYAGQDLAGYLVPARCLAP